MTKPLDHITPIDYTVSLEYPYFGMIGNKSLNVIYKINGPLKPQIWALSYKKSAVPYLLFAIDSNHKSCFY